MNGNLSLRTQSIDVESVSLVRQMRMYLPEWLSDQAGDGPAKEFFHALFSAYGDDLLRAEREKLFEEHDAALSRRAEMYLRHLGLGEAYDTAIASIDIRPMPDDALRARLHRAFENFVTAMIHGIYKARRAPDKRRR